jgi:hypothetical protein
MKSVTRYLSRVTYLQWFITLTLIAVVLAIGLPPDPDSLKQLHTTQTSYRLAVAALLIPYIVIWYFGFFAYGRLKKYLTHIDGAKEERGFVEINLGMGLLAFGLVVPTIISLVLSNIAVHDHGFKPAAIVISNYLSLLVPVLVFTLLGSGVHKLTLISKVRPSYTGILSFMAGFTAIGVVYCYLVLHNYFQSGSPYHLSLWPLLLTYVMPYLYSWFVGLYCAFELRLYAHKVPGKLYRQSLAKFSTGLLVAITGSVSIQFVGSVLNNNKHLQLASVLLLDYILLIIVAVGLALMANGTKGLQRIEEV